MNDLVEMYGGRRVLVALNDVQIHPKAQAIYGYRDIESLADEFRNGMGMIQNPILNKKLQTIAGGRRVLAAKMAGWTHFFATVLDNMPEEDEEYCIVCSNKMRDKTPREKCHEARVYDRELPSRQGQHPKPGEKEYNKRKHIAEMLGKGSSEAEVRDLLEFDESNEELLDTIDGKHVFLTALADKVRKTRGKGLDLSKYVGVLPISLDLCECPFCHSEATKRIEIRGDELFYI